LAFEDSTGMVHTVPHTAMSSLLNSSMCILDSFNSFMYTSAEGRGLGARGISNMVYRQLNRYTYSEVVWNHAHDPNDDAFPNDPKQILTGDFDVERTSAVNQDGKPLLGITTTYTSRFTGRGVRHLLCAEKGGTRYTIDSIGRGGPNNRFVLLRDATTDEFGEFVPFSKVVNRNNSKEEI